MKLWRWKHWIIGPPFAGFLLEMVGGYSKASGKFEGFNWKVGLTIFVVFAILYLLAFAVRFGGRRLLKRLSGPN